MPGKYVIPVIMGQLGRELYLVNGEVPRDQRVVLARAINRRQVRDRDLKWINRIPGVGQYGYIPPSFLTEVEILDSQSVRDRAVSLSQASLIEGFIEGTIRLSRSQTELDGWFVFEKKGDLTPLKIARFSLNLLELPERRALIAPLGGLKSVAGW